MRFACHCLIALILAATTLPTAAAAQSDPQLERLKTEALVMVEQRSDMVQEIVDLEQVGITYRTVRRPPTLQ
jgi:hypothetical protein